jgi:hypothetical protein
VKVLIAGYTAALGDAGCDPTMAAKVMKAAELTAYAEQLRAAVLRGEAVDPLALVRVEGVADRAVRQLGHVMLSPAAPTTSLPTLADLLRSGTR